MTSTGPAPPEGMPPREAERAADAKWARAQTLLGDAARLYAACGERRTDPYHEGRLRRKRWQVERTLGRYAGFASEAGQDRFLYERVFGDRRGGRFIEIGGYDGWAGSNCAFFETRLGWEGVIVEASPSRVESIRRSRRARVIQAAIGDRSGEAEFLEIHSGYTQMGGLLGTYPPDRLQQVRAHPAHAEVIVPVQVMTFAELLDACGFDGAAYCSLDIEGAERAVLSAWLPTWHPARFGIEVFSVENCRGDALGSVADLLVPEGYAFEGVVGADEIYVRQ